MTMARSVYAATEGVASGSLEIEGRPLDLRIRGDLRDWYRRTGNPEALLESLPLPAGQGGTVFLGSLGRVERREAEAALARRDRADVIYLDTFPSPGAGKKLAGIIRGMSPELFRADESVFTRYRFSLVITLVLSLSLLYMTLAAQFESFLLPLILGLAVLFGLAVNNGIILYENSEKKLREGAPVIPAVFSGAHERLRPVLITTCTSVMALIPLAFSALGVSQRSMASAMLGGLLASALLSLFAMPLLFIPFLRRAARIVQAAPKGGSGE